MEARCFEKLRNICDRDNNFYNNIKHCKCCIWNCFFAVKLCFREYFHRILILIYRLSICEMLTIDMYLFISCLYFQNMFGGENSTVENGIRVQIVKSTARKSFSVATQKINKMIQISDIVCKNDKSNKPRLRTNVPKDQSDKRTADQSTATMPAEFGSLLPSINDQGRSGKKQKIDKQLQPSSGTPQILRNPNPTSSTITAIPKLFTTPENPQYTSIMQFEHALGTENVIQELSNNNVPSGSGDQPPPIQRRNQTPFDRNCHPSSTATGIQEDQLNKFLGYIESHLRPLPLKRSIKIQEKVISCVLKYCDKSYSPDYSSISDVCSVSSDSDEAGI